MGYNSVLSEKSTEQQLCDKWIGHSEINLNFYFSFCDRVLEGPKCSPLYSV